jgi:phage tail-like protein
LKNSGPDNIPELSLSRRSLLNGAAVAGGIGLAAAIAGDASSPAQVAAQNVPPGFEVSQFVLEVDGKVVAIFSELAGITTAIDVTEGLPKKLPGRKIPPAVVLKRGMNSSLELWAWHEAALNGDEKARKSCSLIMFDVAGTPLSRYHLEFAWPAKVEIGALRAGASEVLIETVTLTCEDISRVAP